MQKRISKKEMSLAKEIVADEIEMQVHALRRILADILLVRQITADDDVKELADYRDKSLERLGISF